MVSVNKERVLRWVEELREEQEKTAREEGRKEEILQMLGELAKLAEHQRYPAVLRDPEHAWGRGIGSTPRLVRSQPLSLPRVRLLSRCLKL